MDSKQIYNASRRHMGLVRWALGQGNEWSYSGFGTDFRLFDIQRSISSVFPEETILIVIDRHVAYESKTSTAAADIQILQSNQDVLYNREIVLWSKEFQTVMVFARIGVVKHGHVRA